MDLKCKLNKSKSEGINEMYPVWLKTKTKRFHLLNRSFEVAIAGQ